MAIITVSQTPLQIIRDLLVEDRWQAYSTRDDDFRTIEGQVSLIESVAKFIVRANEGFAAYFPEIRNLAELVLEAPRETDGLIRVPENSLALHFETGTEASYITFPGFLQRILTLTDIRFIQPTELRLLQILLSFTIIEDISDINLRPGEDSESDVSIYWDDSPLSLVVRITFESQGKEVVGTFDIDWKHLEILIRFIPRRVAQRLLWSYEVDANFTPRPPLLGGMADGIEKAFQDQIQSLLEDWGLVIVSSILALPLRPLSDENGRIVLSNLDILSLTTFWESFLGLLRDQGVGLDAEVWGDFSHTFINSCLLPNNPLRTLLFSGEFPNLSYEFQLMRLVDHYVRHIEDPQFEPDLDYGPGIIFDVEPIQPPTLREPPEYHEEEYLLYIVQREKYIIILDHIEIKEQLYSRVMERSFDGSIEWRLVWNIDVSHSHLDGGGWATLQNKEVEIQSRSRNIALGNKGISIDWLESGGDAQLNVYVYAFGREEANFQLRCAIPQEFSPSGCMALSYEDEDVVAKGRLTRLTTFNHNELDWIRVIIRHIHLDIPENINEFFLQWFEDPPEGEDVTAWLNNQIISRLHIAIFINGDRASLINFNQNMVNMIRNGIGITLPERSATYDLFYATEGDASFEIRTALWLIEPTGEDREIATIGSTIHRHNPAYPRLEWGIPYGAPNRQLVLHEAGNPLHVTMGVQNKLPSDPPLEFVPKPYNITITNIHLERGTERWDGKEEVKYWRRMQTETDGIPSDPDEHPFEVIASFREWEPHDINFSEDDIIHYTPSVPVGSTITIAVKGKEYDPRFHDDLGITGIPFEITAGDSRDGIYNSSSTGYFTFQISVRTAKRPPEILFEVDRATRYEQQFPPDTYLRLEVATSESWIFRSGVSWAESFVLQFSPDRGETPWRSVDSLAPLSIGTIETNEVAAPPGGQFIGWYRLLARNNVGETESIHLRLVVT